MKAQFNFPIETLTGGLGAGKGLVFFNWRGIDCARGNAIPRNPQSSDQNAIRNILTQCALAFQSVTPAEKEGWQTLAEVVPSRYRGKDIILPANAIYTKINSYRLLGGKSIIDTAPTTKPSFVGTGFSGVTFSSGTGELEFDCAHTGNAVDNACVVFITPPLPSMAAEIKETDFRLAAGAGAGNDSIKLLSGAGPVTLTFTSPRFTTYTNGCYMGIKIIPLNGDYVPGTPYFEKVQVTVI